ncbi:unnamed protein product [Blepharisma stoltei]|uniref:Nucleoplasmin-like domain-containing protein n=1 Tax=Blepharisma stoltei TaxID=1481888 RepID=A0AAU9KF13_9CILI|nr:unnamed protein product [Blepharisma stoltei]
MFWGCCLKQNKGEVLESKGNGRILHLSHAVLDMNGWKSKEWNTVYLSYEGKKVPIAELNETQNSVDIDLMISRTSAPHFSLKGASDVYLLGYFEPKEEIEEKKQKKIVISDESDSEDSD